MKHYIFILTSIIFIFNGFFTNFLGEPIKVKANNVVLCVFDIDLNKVKIDDVIYAKGGNICKDEQVKITSGYLPYYYGRFANDFLTGTEIYEGYIEDGTYVSVTFRIKPYNEGKKANIENAKLPEENAEEHKIKDEENIKKDLGTENIVPDLKPSEKKENLNLEDSINNSIEKTKDLLIDINYSADELKKLKEENRISVGLRDGQLLLIIDNMYEQELSENVAKALNIIEDGSEIVQVMDDNGKPTGEFYIKNAEGEVIDLPEYEKKDLIEEEDKEVLEKEQKKDNTTLFIFLGLLLIVIVALVVMYLQNKKKK